MFPLGQPLPNSVHAVSVSLPKWADVVGYEEGEARVLDALQLGYPRFVYHPLVKQLFAKCEAQFAKEGEFCIAFPSQKVAEKCAVFCAAPAKINILESQTSNLYSLTLPEALRAKAKEFWQHAGFVVSSRLAESFLDNRHPSPITHHPKIKNHLGQLANANPEDIYLFPTGMAAIFTSHQLVSRIANRESLTTQLGFPYLDTLKIQQKWGGAEFVAFDAPEEISADSQAVFTEFPLNPLLQQVDFTRLRQEIGTKPLIIDDTLATWQNFRALDYADIAVTSLTKFYSGIGDVTAGSLILNKNSPHYTAFKAALAEIYENLLFAEDAEILWKNAQGYAERIKKINENAKKLVNFLVTHHPSPITHHFGGMISVIFAEAEQAIAFYDALQVCKGPSLGTEYTLACPYTLLAHYRELDWAASCGVPAHLVRISVGCEDYAELQKTFETALKIAGSKVLEI